MSFSLGGRTVSSVTEPRGDCRRVPTVAQARERCPVSGANHKRRETSGQYDSVVSTNRFVGGVRRGVILTERLEEDRLLGHHLADEARRVSLSWFRRTLDTRTKADGGLVTDADLAVEDALRSLLAAERPTDSILGEERGQTGSSERRWFLDGIDGTEAFVAGKHEWGTLIALEVAGEVVLGIVDQPALGRRYWAAIGLGAHECDGAGGSVRQLHVSEVTALEQCRSYLPPPEWRGDRRVADAAARLGSIARPEPARDHPAIQVAWGGYEVALFGQAGPWDFAAPALIVSEAGGRFSDLDGHFRLDTGSGLFTNGLVHDVTLEKLRDGKG